MKISTGIIPHHERVNAFLSRLVLSNSTCWYMCWSVEKPRWQETKWRESILLKMTSFAEIVRVTDCQKVHDLLGNAKQKLGNVLREGEHLLLS